MSPRSGSRPAALPSSGYRPAPRLHGQGQPQVRFTPETPGREQVYDFRGWPVTAELQRAFAHAFAARTRPGGSIRATGSANQCFRIMRAFARHLASGEQPPRTPSELSAAHVKSWMMSRRDHVSLNTELAVLKLCLRRVPGVTDGFVACLHERNPARRRSREGSYSRAELAHVLAAARRDVRRAADRIEAGRFLLHRWRTSGLDGEPELVKRRGRLLDLIDRGVEIPRSGPRGFPVYWVQSLGSLQEHFAMLHLTVSDIAAFVVLLTGLTGQNRSTILNAPAAHHGADGYACGPATAVVELDKPRRGRHRHMDVALADLPPWAAAPTGSPADAGKDLRTPFGVYMLLHDLAGPARLRAGSDRLIAWWAARGGDAGGFHHGLSAHQVADWAGRHELLADPPAGDIPAAPLNVTLRRLRLTFTELQQRPVAHTERTLANEYLARDRGNLTEYQRVVAAALDEQVAQAKTRGRISALSAVDLAEARIDPARVAARHSMDTRTLERLLTGQLDTVLNGCIDHTGGPNNPGQACRASFMLCLSCPCARATPQHLPIQVLVHDELAARRHQMTPLRWAQRFALPHAQLNDLLQRADAVAVTDARHEITDTDHALVDRFLHRELDLR